jgi:hypothetical protein
VADFLRIFLIPQYSTVGQTVVRISAEESLQQTARHRLQVYNRAGCITAAVSLSWCAAADIPIADIA